MREYKFYIAEIVDEVYHHTPDEGSNEHRPQGEPQKMTREDLGNNG